MRRFLIFALWAFPCLAADVNLQWDHSPDALSGLISGYRVYYGRQSRVYDAYHEAGYVTTHTVIGLSSGKSFFAVTAISTTGVESEYSNELEIVIGATPWDFDGDGKTDVAVWRPDDGMWFIIPSATPDSPIQTQWGMPGDIPVAADYDGDRIWDVAVWRPSGGIWFIMPSGSPGTYYATQWGLETDLPVLGDYDGDGKNDVAVWRPETGTWYILPSGNPETFLMIQWGIPTDIPVQGAR